MEIPEVKNSHYWSRQMCHSADIYVYTCAWCQSDSKLLVYFSAHNEKRFMSHH